VSDKWVINASPIILLAKVGEIELLSRLAGTLVVPNAVVTEIEEGPASDPARAWLGGAGAKWTQRDPAASTVIAAWDLGRGETAVLNWAFHQRDFEAILDDRAARKCAQVHGIPYRGTLGIILAAKKRGLIRAARPVCEKIVEAGLLIEGSLLEKALMLVGE